MKNGDIFSLVMAFIVIMILITGIIFGRKYEKKKWNNGFCAKCNKPWRYFDNDSQGARMYKCDNGHHCDISYKVDK